jgi:pimeloyl-ACP methyl ester carboxylesterase
MAAGVAVIAVALFIALRPRWPATVGGLLALAMAGGSIVHLLQVRAVDAEFPPPGTFVEVDGQQLHVLAEGPVNDGPTIVLFGGGHAPGTSMMFLHDALKEDYRSVLIDRPGMGWSGPASFPVSTHREASQIWRALDQVGVEGPIMLAGHSFGGLLAANMARLRPQAVHALVAMDPTPPDVILYGPRLDELSSLSSDPWWNGFFRLFALDYQALKGAEEEPEYYRMLEEKIAATMGPAYEIQKAYATRPRAHMAAHSIFKELTPQGMAMVGYETGFFTGELGEVPLFLFAPQNQVGMEEVTAFQDAEQREAMRLQRLYSVMRERFLDYSNNSTRIVAPEGSGHNFLYELPDYTIDILEQIAAGTYGEVEESPSEATATAENLEVAEASEVAETNLSE